GPGVADAVHRDRVRRDGDAGVGQPLPAAQRLPVPDLDDGGRDDAGLARVGPRRLQVEAGQQLPVPAHGLPPLPCGAFPQWSSPSHAPLTIGGPPSARPGGDGGREGGRYGPADRAGPGARRVRTPAASPPTSARTPRGRWGTDRPPPPGPV